ncbi:MAG: ParB/RepB/Spo0J family partition protein [Aggregatilineales bacterium]
MSEKREQNKSLIENFTGEPDVEAFGERDYDDEIFAALEATAVQQNTMPIAEIDADVTQPRRIVPADVRGEWDGNAADVPALLETWRLATGNSLTVPMIHGILTGKKSIHDYAEDNNPVLDALLNTLDLARQIHDVGLQQPIGVISTGSRYRLIFGERRWLAFHMLTLWVGAKWDSIPARVAYISEWELAKIQAAENFQRVDLNAVEKSRQFAKLLMTARATGDNDYTPWHQMVVPGGCDRLYYAQVANGNNHAIPYGMGAEFEAALGISTAQMRQYRALLKLTDHNEVNDALWMMGDVCDWSENFLREIGQLVDVSTIATTLNRYGRNGSQIESALRDAIKQAKFNREEEKRREAMQIRNEKNQEAERYIQQQHSDRALADAQTRAELAQHAPPPALPRERDAPEQKQVPKMTPRGMGDDAPAATPAYETGEWVRFEDDGKIYQVATVRRNGLSFIREDGIESSIFFFESFKKVDAPENAPVSSRRLIEPTDAGCQTILRLIHIGEILKMACDDADEHEALSVANDAMRWLKDVETADLAAYTQHDLHNQLRVVASGLQKLLQAIEFELTDITDYIWDGRWRDDA